MFGDEFDFPGQKTRFLPEFRELEGSGVLRAAWQSPPDGRRIGPTSPGEVRCQEAMPRPIAARSSSLRNSGRKPPRRSTGKGAGTECWTRAARRSIAGLLARD